MSDNYEPSGIEFYDAASGRRMLLVDDGEPRASARGWLFYWNDAYGNWVSLRKATDADLLQLAKASE